MGIIGWLRRKPKEPEGDDGSSNNLAFVLLSEARLPDADEITACFSSFAAPGEELRGEPEGETGDLDGKVLSLRLGSGELCFVALMPIAVPNGEADEGARFSLSSFRANWALPPHHAHLLVTLRSQPGTPSHVSLSRFTSVLAAVTKASPAVGIYWGNAGATHDSEFFMSVAEDQDIVPRMMLWTGVSMARERDGRLSLLSLGMKQLKLPDLLLVAGPTSEDIALETMFDLLAYVAQRGEPIAEGETVGRSDEQRLPVSYVGSPVDSKLKVWRVELP